MDCGRGQAPIQGVGSMKRYYVEFNFKPSLGLYVMAYSKQHVKDMFPEYGLITIDQTD